MIWILGFYSLTVILFLIIITSERKESKRYGLAIDYLETYDQYSKDSYLDWFSQKYTSPSGDKIVAFGRYEYDG